MNALRFPTHSSNPMPATSQTKFAANRKYQLLADAAGTGVVSGGASMTSAVLGHPLLGAIAFTTYLISVVCANIGFHSPDSD